MKLLLNSLVLAVLFTMTTLSIGLLLLFSQHYRLVSVHVGRPGQGRPGDAILQKPDGEVGQVMPGAGLILDRLHRLPILLAVVIMPASLVIGGQIRYLWRCYARPGYSARLEL